MPLGLMPLLAAGVVAAASYGAGLALSAGGRVGIADGLRKEATVFSLGFGALALVALGLGLAGAFDRAVLASVAGAAALVALPRLARGARSLPARWRSAGLERWGVAIAVLVVVANLVLAAAPPTSGDALAYHLTAPKLWLHAGRMFDIWWDWSTFQPFAAEMHNAYAMALDGGRAASVVGAILGGLSTVPVYGLSRAVAGPRTATVAALIWVGQGMFTWEATGSFVELPLAGLIALGAWHLVEFARSGRRADAAWSGLAFGLAASVKGLGLPAVAVAAVGLLVVAGSGTRTKALSAFALLAAVALPWYVRAWIVTGNPLYPGYVNLFGGRYVSNAVQAAYVANWTGFGVSGIWHLPVFPLEFVLHTSSYERGYTYSPALFLLAPIGVVLGGRSLRLLGLGVVAFLVFWWESLHQVTRYLYPILPFMTLLAAVGAVALWERGRAARRVVGVVALVTALACAAMVGLFAWRVLPGALGVEAEGPYVQRLTGTYDALKWLDTRLPQNGRLLIGLRNVYYLDRPYVRFTEPLFTWAQPRAVTVARMRRYHVRYLAFYADHMPPSIAAIRSSLRPIAVLDVPEVDSRTFARVVPEHLAVYEWNRR